MCIALLCWIGALHNWEQTTEEMKQGHRKTDTPRLKAGMAKLGGEQE